MASVSQCSSGYGLYIPIDEYKIGFCQLPVCLVTREKVYAIPIVGSCSNCTRAVVNEFDIGEFRFADSKFCYEKELITIGNTSTGTMSSTVAQVSPTQVPAPETGEISRPTIQFLLGLLDRYLGQIENQGFQSIPAGNVKWPVGVPRTSEWEPNVRDPTIIIEDNGDANPLGTEAYLKLLTNQTNLPLSYQTKAKTTSLLLQMNLYLM
jgi:hypothetical protein